LVDDKGVPDNNRIRANGTRRERILGGNNFVVEDASLCTAVGVQQQHKRNND